MVSRRQFIAANAARAARAGAEGGGGRGYAAAALTLGLAVGDARALAEASGSYGNGSVTSLGVVSSPLCNRQRRAGGARWG